MSPLSTTLAVIKALILCAVSHSVHAAELLVATALSVCTGMAFPRGMAAVAKAGDHGVVRGEQQRTKLAQEAR